MRMEYNGSSAKFHVGGHLDGHQQVRALGHSVCRAARLQTAAITVIANIIWRRRTEGY
jgi:hypothetical protein